MLGLFLLQLFTVLLIVAVGMTAWMYRKAAWRTRALLLGLRVSSVLLPSRVAARLVARAQPSLVTDWRMLLQNGMPEIGARVESCRALLHTADCTGLRCEMDTFQRYVCKVMYVIEQSTSVVSRGMKMIDMELAELHKQSDDHAWLLRYLGCDPTQQSCCSIDTLVDAYARINPGHLYTTIVSLRKRRAKEQARLLRLESCRDDPVALLRAMAESDVLRAYREASKREILLQTAGRITEQDLELRLADLPALSQAELDRRVEERATEKREKIRRGLLRSGKFTDADVDAKLEQQEVKSRDDAQAMFSTITDTRDAVTALDQQLAGLEARLEGDATYQAYARARQLWSSTGLQRLSDAAASVTSQSLEGRRQLGAHYERIWRGLAYHMACDRMGIAPDSAICATGALWATPRGDLTPEGGEVDVAIITRDPDGAFTVAAVVEMKANCLEGAGGLMQYAHVLRGAAQAGEAGFALRFSHEGRDCVAAVDATAWPRVFLCTSPSKVLPPHGLLLGSRDELITPLVRSLYAGRHTEPTMRRLDISDAAAMEKLFRDLFSDNPSAILAANLRSVMHEFESHILLLPPPIRDTLSWNRIVEDLWHGRAETPKGWASRTGIPTHLVGDVDY